MKHVCDVAGCEQGFDTMAEVIAHEQTHNRLVLDRPVLTIDPKRQFGRICIGGTRIPAETLGEMVAAGDGVDDLADAYEVTRDEVLLACWWHAQECAHYRTKQARRVTAAWGEWADKAARILGGWENEPLSDPPDVKG